MSNTIGPKRRILLAGLVTFSILCLNACTGSDLIEGTAPEINSADTATFSEETEGAFTVTATGSPAPILSVSGALPAGVTFDPSTGVLSGTPEAGTFAVYPLTITAGNGVSPDAAQSFTLTVIKTVDLVANGSFENELASWSQGAYSEAGASGTCRYNGDVAPGEETLTSTEGFPSTDGSRIALGYVSSSSGTAARISCALYQDIAIPAGTTRMTLSFDIAAKAGNDNCLKTGGFIGIYSAASVPALGNSPVIGTVTQHCTSTDETTLKTYTRIMASAAAVEGTTVRLGFINAANMDGHEVIGIDNVKLLATIVP